MSARRSAIAPLTSALASALTSVLVMSAASASSSSSTSATTPAPVREPLAVQPGDYIEGQLDSGTRRVDLTLVNREGRPIRRLLNRSLGAATFRFVVAPEMGEGLALVASPGAPTPTWKRIPRAEQRLPAPTYASAAITALAGALARGESGALARFWDHAAQAGTPLVEPLPDGRARITFLWRGAERNVRLFGSPSDDHEWLERLPGSDVWFKTFDVPMGLRLSYQLAPDVPDLPSPDFRTRRAALLATVQRDPLNPVIWPADAPDRFTQQSIVTLPAAPVQPGLTGAPVDIGELQRLTIASATLGNTREVTIQRPPGFDASRADTVLLFVFDADEYLGAKVPTPEILARLQRDGRLPQTVAVFVANPDRAARGRELPGNPDFADFMALEVLPRVLRATGLRADPARTVLAGSSYGGLASATVALRHPARFGNVLSMSGSFWWFPQDAPPTRPHAVASQVLAQRDRLPLRFFLSAGLYEGPHPDSDGILQTNRHLRDVLEARGYPVIHREYVGGHDYVVWRGALADGMLALFGRE